MPPWPHRLHLGSPATTQPSQHPKSRGLTSPAYQDLDIEIQCHDPPLLGVPTLAAPDSIAPSPPRTRPRHGRSHSNPFTSLFGNGKKLDRADDTGIQNDMVDSTDDLLNHTPRPQSKEHMAGANGGFSQVAGKCMTCDSNMKWPRQLDSFRCQMCYMINDLKPSSKPLGDVLAGDTPNNTTILRPGTLKKGELNASVLMSSLDTQLQSPPCHWKLPAV